MCSLWEGGSPLSNLLRMLQRWYYRMIWMIDWYGFLIRKGSSLLSVSLWLLTISMSKLNKRYGLKTFRGYLLILSYKASYGYQSFKEYLQGAFFDCLGCPLKWKVVNVVGPRIPFKMESCKCCWCGLVEETCDDLLYTCYYSWWVQSVILKCWSFAWILPQTGGGYYSVMG